jgi:hypothetical protein
MNDFWRLAFEHFIAAGRGSDYKQLMFTCKLMLDIGRDPHIYTPAKARLANHLLTLHKMFPDADWGLYIYGNPNWPAELLDYDDPLKFMHSLHNPNVDFARAIGKLLAASQRERWQMHRLYQNPAIALETAAQIFQHMGSVQIDLCWNDNFTIADLKSFGLKRRHICMNRNFTTDMIRASYGITACTRLTPT